MIPVHVTGVQHVYVVQMEIESWYTRHKGHHLIGEYRGTMNNTVHISSQINRYIYVGGNDSLSPSLPAVDAVPVPGDVVPPSLPAVDNDAVPVPGDVVPPSLPAVDNDAVLVSGDVVTLSPCSTQ